MKFVGFESPKRRNSRPTGFLSAAHCVWSKKSLYSREGATLVAARHSPEATYYERQLVYCIEPDEKLKKTMKNIPLGADQAMLL